MYRKSTSHHFNLCTFFRYLVSKRRAEYFICHCFPAANTNGLAKWTFIGLPNFTLHIFCDRRAHVQTSSLMCAFPLVKFNLEFLHRLRCQNQVIRITLFYVNIALCSQQHHHQQQQHQSQWQTTVLLKLMNGFQHSLLSLHLYID